MLEESERAVFLDQLVAGFGISAPETLPIWIHDPEGNWISDSNKAFSIGDNHFVVGDPRSGQVTPLSTAVILVGGGIPAFFGADLSSFEAVFVLVPGTFELDFRVRKFWRMLGSNASYGSNEIFQLSETCCQVGESHIYLAAVLRRNSDKSYRLQNFLAGPCPHQYSSTPGNYGFERLLSALYSALSARALTPVRKALRFLIGENAWSRARTYFFQHR